MLTAFRNVSFRKEKDVRKLTKKIPEKKIIEFVFVTN